jgi:hypothetical protein
LGWLERTALFIHRALLKGNDLQIPMEFCKRLLLVPGVLESIRLKARKAEMAAQVKLELAAAFALKRAIPS